MAQGCFDNSVCLLIEVSVPKGLLSISRKSCIPFMSIIVLKTFLYLGLEFAGVNYEGSFMVVS
jgi:hypothetical protein